jgi:3'(2'), 5'-bisphosphate nucleotidase
MPSTLDIVQEHAGSLAKEMRVAAQLAREAGEIALLYHGEDISVDLKIGDEPVTVADRECSAHVVKGLREAFPEDVVISEEVDDDERRLKARRVWYVDPIDGTKAFIRGESGYSVMIGLALEHQPVLGVICQPNYNTLVFAEKGHGAWVLRNSECQAIHTSDIEGPEDARHLGPRVPPADWLLISDLLGPVSTERISSVGLKLCTIAVGASDLYVSPYTHCSSWDTCAPQVILEEAGGQISDMHGHPLRYDLAEMKHKTGVVASNGAMHAAVIQKFSGLFPHLGSR